MKEFVFDWDIFKNRGFDFQEMCTDIFKAYQYYVRVLEKGGSDEGRDIIIYKNIPEGLVEFNDTPYAWVECKSQVNGSPINLNKINTNFLYVFDEEVSYLVFMTNHKFNNEAHNLFVRYNRNDKIPFKIRYIEREELEYILKATPSVYIKYFDKGGKVEEYPKFELNGKAVKHKISTNSYFFNEVEDLHVTIKNPGLTTNEVNIRITDHIIIHEKLEPLEEKNVKIQINKNQLPEDININHRIDYIYVDPFNVKAKITKLLKYHKCIYICGRAGTGKSRLLSEVAKELNRKSVFIDISADYCKSFLDYMLSCLLEMEAEYLRLLPDEVISAYLEKLLSKSSIPVFLAYIRQDSGNLNYDVLLSETAGLFNRQIQNQIIYIDNIHCFSILDYKLLERLNDIDHTNYLLITARENEISEKCLSGYLESYVRSGRFGIINLTKTDLTAMIQNFIQKSCADDSTKSFLAVYRHPENFQQFIFTLKTLRLKGIITQGLKGEIAISENTPDMSIGDYKELCNDLRKYYQAKFPDIEICGILELGATYGYKFPVELVEEFYGDQAVCIVDSLLVHEFLKEDLNDLSGSIFVCFDHELTRDIIYQAISPIQKKKLHRQIINYIENLGELSSLYQYSQLSHHYKCINNYPKAAEYANKEGHRLMQKSLLETSLHYFESALDYVDIVQKKDMGDLYEIEADALAQVIKLRFSLYRMDDIEGKIKSLEVLSFLLSEMYYKGIACFYYAKYYFEENNRGKSLLRIQEAIDIFHGSEYAIEYADCLNFKGVVLKNNGKFDEAEEVHRLAISIFKKHAFWQGVSDSLAEMGAVYLESNRGAETAAYWKESLEAAKKTINSVDICNRLIDYSYILALYDKDNREISNYMERSVFMAEKLAVKPAICRAKINYANYLFFSTPVPDLEKIKTLIKDAEIKSTEIKDDYLLLLSRFSYYTFGKRNAAVFDLDFEEDIVGLLLTLYSDQKLTRVEGDNRIMNIVTYMAHEGNDKIRTFAENCDLPYPQEDNPYFIHDLFATYY